jgi:hypothetical protein
MKIAAFEIEPREAAPREAIERIVNTTVSNIVSFLDGAPANVVVRAGEKVS